MSTCGSRSDTDKVSMKQWADAFKELYSAPDSKRRPEEFWNSVMAHLSSVGEAIRKTNYNEVVQESAYAFCWMCGLMAKCSASEEDPVFQIDHGLSELVALKFPDRCGHCKEVHCICDPIAKDAERDKAGEYEKLYVNWSNYKSVWPTRSFDEWLNEFQSIFGARSHIQTLESIGFHMLEEAGEEAKAVRQLVQFRGLAETKDHGVSDEFLKKLTRIDSLVCAYGRYSKEAKKELGKSFKLALEEDPKSILTSKEDVIVRTRLVYAKMDFVIELADTFSWLCAVLLKLKKIIDALNLTQEKDKLKFNVEQALRESFAQYDGDGKIVRVNGPDSLPKLKCYMCKEENCQCRFFPEEPPKKAAEQVKV